MCCVGERWLEIKDGFSSPEEKYRNGPMTLWPSANAEILEEDIYRNIVYREKLYKWNLFHSIIAWNIHERWRSACLYR